MTEQAVSSERDHEPDWIARAQAGDKAAFGQLVLRYRRLVVSVAYHHGLDLAEAEDVAQETFVKAWLALPRYREPIGSLRAWLCRIAINTARDVHRRERPAQELDEDMIDGNNSPAEQAEINSEAMAVRRALDQIPAASRAALVLREYEGLAYAEIATALGIPVGTVMSRLSFARSRLRELLIAAGEVA